MPPKLTTCSADVPVAPFWNPQVPPWRLRTQSVASLYSDGILNLKEYLFQIFAPSLYGLLVFDW